MHVGQQVSLAGRADRPFPRILAFFFVPLPLAPSAEPPYFGVLFPFRLSIVLFFLLFFLFFCHCVVRSLPFRVIEDFNLLWNV